MSTEEPSQAQPDPHIWESARTWTLERTVAIYYQMPEGNAVQHGSGILLRIADAVFLVSCSHVLEIANEASLWLAGMDPKRQGPMVQIAPTQVMRTQDQSKHDLGFARLPEVAVAALGKMKCFVQLSDLDLEPELPQGRYYAAGYPIQLTKSDHSTKKIDVGTFTYITYLKDPEEPIPGVVIALAYEKDAVFTARNGAPGSRPHLQGVSGSGLWRLWQNKDAPRLAQWGTSWIRLVGIEHHVGGTTILGTLIHNLVRLIVRLNPEFKPAVALYMDL